MKYIIIILLCTACKSGVKHEPIEPVRPHIHDTVYKSRWDDSIRLLIEKHAQYQDSVIRDLNRKIKKLKKQGHHIQADHIENITITQ